jgi:hypothetical protein
MATLQTAGGDYAGRFCQKCRCEIQPTDKVVVDEDADSDGEGGWRDLTTVEHFECPEDADV